MPKLHHRVRQSGGESRGTLVFVHGVGSRAAAWDLVVEHLPQDVDIITYDLRGHGESEKVKGPYTVDDFVDDHLQVLGELGLKKTHLIGASLGGLIVQRTAIREPQVVDRLVIMNSFAGLTDEERAARLERYRLLADGNDAWSNVSNDRWFTSEFLRDRPDLVKEHTRRLASNDRDCYVAAYEVLATNDFVDDLHRIQSPTLVMTGDGDVGGPPQMSELMGRLIPDARVVILAGQKHMPWIEQPHVVARHIAEFLNIGSNEYDQPASDDATRVPS